MQNDILTPKVKETGRQPERAVLTPKTEPVTDRRVGETPRKDKFGTMSLIQEEKRTDVINGLIDPASVFGQANIEKLDKKFAEKEKEFWKESAKRNKL